MKLPMERPKGIVSSVTQSTLTSGVIDTHEASAGYLYGRNSKYMRANCIVARHRSRKKRIASAPLIRLQVGATAEKNGGGLQRI